MASVVYNGFKTKIQNGSIDLDTDTIRVVLLTNSYTPNIDTDLSYADISAVETSGTGYSAGGTTLSGCTVTQDNTNDRGVFDANDASWTTSTITARWGVVLKWTGTANTSWLICGFDFGSDIASTGGTFAITWNANGILALT